VLRVRPEADYGHIEYDTRLFVWQRDGGRCRHCGSREEMQFDHVIPRSRGGSGLASNVELLCGPCNRRKGTLLMPPA
jgi:5-methylcytosine-specific restriction endonuclease McrA